MTSFKKLNFEYKTGILFGGAAFMLSFLTGIVSGIPFKSVIFRSFIMLLVFAALGFAVIYVMKKFVPEFYDFLSNSFTGEGSPGEDKAPGEAAGEPSFERISDEEFNPDTGAMKTAEDMGDTKDKTEEFSELTGQSFPKYETVADKDLEPSVNISEGKMGKHIIQREKISKYEPKLMAEAIRTMMSRNQE